MSTDTSEEAGSGGCPHPGSYLSVSRQLLASELRPAGAKNLHAASIPYVEGMPTFSVCP